MKYEITKGSEKDFEQAPEWATQLLRDNNDSKKSFVGELGGVTLVAEKMNPHSWWKYNDGHVGTIIAERRPITEPVWDGEGLPPAGVECEAKYRSGGSEWSPFKCVAPDKELAFGWSGDEPVILLEDLYEFRPIRSPEDVARDEFINELSGSVIEGSSIGTKFAAALYDAGYRKME